MYIYIYIDPPQHCDISSNMMYSILNVITQNNYDIKLSTIIVVYRLTT